MSYDHRRRHGGLEQQVRNGSILCSSFVRRGIASFSRFYSSQFAGMDLNSGGENGSGGGYGGRDGYRGGMESGGGGGGGGRGGGSRYVPPHLRNRGFDPSQPPPAVTQDQDYGVFKNPSICYFIVQF